MDKRTCNGLINLGTRSAVLLVMAVCCAVAIFLFSSQDNSASHLTSDGVVSFVASLTDDGFNQLGKADRAVVIKALDEPVRKAAHATEYAVLGIVLFAALGSLFPVEDDDSIRRGRREQAGGIRTGGRIGMFLRTRVRLALLICFAYSCTDEFHQLFSSGRTTRFSDCIIDTVGAAVGIMVACGISALMRERARRLK